MPAYSFTAFVRQHSRHCAVVGIAVAMSACATDNSNVRVDQDKTADLAHCRTFGWHPADQQGASSLNEQRIRSAVMQTLKSKGYSEAADTPDCRVSYSLETRELRKHGPSVGVGAGGGSGGLGGGIGISLPLGRKHKFASTLVIDVIDATRNAQIWTASLDETLHGQDISEDEAQRAVKEILGRYPNRAAQ